MVERAGVVPRDEGINRLLCCGQFSIIFLLFPCLVRIPLVYSMSSWYACHVYEQGRGEAHEGVSAIQR
jgi:hypothetical protein